MMALVLKFIVDNPWRSGCILLTIACIGLYYALSVQGLRLDRANLQREKAEAQTAKLVTDGIVQDRAIAISENELAVLRKKQLADAKRIADLLKNWPTDCTEAAQTAANIFRERTK